MPFGRDMRVVLGNTVLDRGPGFHGKGRFGSQSPVRSDVTYRQITLIRANSLLSWFYVVV